MLGTPEVRRHVALKRTLALGLSVVTLWLCFGGQGFGGQGLGGQRGFSQRPASTPPVPSAGANAQPSPSHSPGPVKPRARPRKPACPKEMVHVTGQYCTKVRHSCLRWLDDQKLPYARCAEYSQASCEGKRVLLDFCIDRFEYTEPGQRLPENQLSFVKAEAVCRSLGKRICHESEWNFACEGERMLPYPYGHLRQPKCNQDQKQLYEPGRGTLRDLREPSGSESECKSPFGVYDLVGNLDEPVLRDPPIFSERYRGGLKGGWWMAGRNRCRPTTTAHDVYYFGIQVGARCCKSIEIDGSDPL